MLHSHRWPSHQFLNAIIINQSNKYVVFKPGFTDRKQLSKILSNIFERDISEIEKLLPNGGFELVKSSGIDIKLE